MELTYPRLVYTIVSLIMPRECSEADPFSVVRSAISIVPQSPDLFEGTLRENIDPVGTYQDADIWVALGQVSNARGLPLKCF